MYDLIKNILDAVTNLVPKAIAARREARLRSLGAHLFTIYLDAYDIVWRGERILEILEKARAGHPGAISTTEFRHLLHEQSMALTDLNGQIREYIWCLGFIAPEEVDLFRSLTSLKGGRITALQIFAKSLKDDSIPRNAAATEVSTSNISANKLFGSFKSKSEVRRLLALLLAEPNVEQALRFESTIDGRIAEIAVEVSDLYLNEFDPRAQLQEIKDVLRRLRGELDKFFTPSDILIELSQARQAKASIKRVTGY